QPVHGLEASDFRITENGKPVTIGSFEEHSAAAAPSVAPLEPLRLGTNSFSNVPRVPPNGPLTVLLLDVLNTPLVNQAFVHQQILLYLKQLDPGARIAIFVLGTRLYFLQGFTSDPAVLQAAIERKQGGMRLSPLMANAISGPPGPVLAEDTEDMTDRLEGISQNQQVLDAESAGVLATLSRVAIERQVERVRE